VSVAMMARGRGWAIRALIVTLLALAARPVSAQRRGTVETDEFESAALGARKRYYIYLPPTYASDALRRYPVVYYLHGARGSETDWVQRGGIDVVMDSLVAAGVPEMIVVMPDGDDGWYTSWAPDFPWRACPVRTDLREPAATCCGRRPRYDRYLAEDLVRHIDATYRTAADARHRGIAGLSMGGYGAMALAAQHPGVWSAAASHSGVISLLATAVDTAAGTVEYALRPDTLQARWPGLWPLLVPVFGPRIADWRERDPARRLALLKEDAPARLPALYIDAGTSDSAYILNTRAFRAELTRLGVPFEYHEYAGGHDWRYWRAHVGQSLAWLAGRIAQQAP
jgi:S-formylglutathione hydrolase FrmB